MRYHSRDHNCCIETHDDPCDVNGRPLADVSVLLPCLVDTRIDERNLTILLLSRASGAKICSLTFTAICPGDLRRMHINHMPTAKVTLFEDAQRETKASGSIKNHFGVVLDEAVESTVATYTSPERLYPDIGARLLDIVSKRRRQDEQDIEEYMRRKTLEFELFEAEVNAQAAALSNIAFSTTKTKEDEPLKPSTMKSTDRQCLDTTKDARRLSNSSMHSAASTASDKPRRKPSKQTKKHPIRSSTNPLPKPALTSAVRKSSLGDIKDGKVVAALSKRVMFSEQEPLRIDSPHTLDASDTEEDTLEGIEPEHEDLFDMDETIPVVPIQSQIPKPLDIPGTVSISSPARQRTPFGRQEDAGLSGSFRIRSLDKYGPPSTKSLENIDLDLPDISETEPSAFATSFPRDIFSTPHMPTLAPLNSVKDIPSLSPSQIDLADDPLENLGDTPPPGMSRKTMWTKAVASSLRMSGLVLPTMLEDDIETSLPTSTRQSIRG